MKRNLKSKMIWLAAPAAVVSLAVLSSGRAIETVERNGAPLPAQGDDYPWVVRSGPIDLDLKVLHNAALNAHTRPQIVLQLFEDLELPVEVRYSEFREENRFSIAGAVPKAIGSNATMSVCIDAAYGVISVPPLGLFEIRYGGDGVHIVRELDETLMLECGVGADDGGLLAPPPPPRVQRPQVPRSRQPAGAPGHPPHTPSQLLNDGLIPTHHVPVVNILVVYTPAARNNAGGLNGMLAQVDTAMLQTNQALAASNAGLLVHLADAREVAYVENNTMGVDLQRLQHPNDGHMDIVHQWREDTCADLVAMLGYNPNYNSAGVAWMPDEPVQNNPSYWADWAFSVTWTNYIPNFTFAHEVGHNLGCHHDHNNATGTPSFPYAYGHRFVGASSTLWRTIMAYVPGIRVLHYSNPNILFDGVPTGIPAGQPFEADNAQAIANNAPHIATYRDLIGGTCAPVTICHWDNTVGMPGVNNIVHTMTVFDDGTGDALYVGGNFTTAGGVTVNHIARWDGQQWTDLAGGLDGPVFSLEVFDDGTGPALYVGGTFTTTMSGVIVNRIAKWDSINQSWSDLDGGMSSGIVSAMAVYDDGLGAGQQLYAGGRFANAGSVVANSIARWDGSNWEAIGTGIMPWEDILALQVYDDGTGQALFAAGHFASIDGIPANHIARYDGTAWTDLDGGVTSGLLIFALEVYDDGVLGEHLVVGGSFGSVGSGGLVVQNIARWDGTQWHTENAIPAFPPFGVNGMVFALKVYDDGLGAGPLLYAAGMFTSAAGAPNASRIAKMAPAGFIGWGSLGHGLNDLVFALAEFDDGTSGAGPVLYAGGQFTASGLQPAGGIAAWDGCPPPPSCAACPPGGLDESEPCGATLNNQCGESSCIGYCGGQSPAGCWCDAICCAAGDCCLDQEVVCDQCSQSAVTPLPCNQTICGTLWLYSATGLLDLDRYGVEVLDLHGTGIATMTVEVEADIDVHVWIDNGRCPSDPLHFVYAGPITVSACTLTSLSAIVPAPSVTYISIEPADPTTTPGCSNPAEYHIHVDVDTCFTVSDLCPNAVLVGTVNQLPFDNIGAATDGPPEPGCGFNGVDDSDVWFEFIAGHDKFHMATVEPVLMPGFQDDRLLAAYDHGCPVAGQSPLNCKHAIGGAAACVTFIVGPGDTVIIRSGTPSGAAGQGHSLLTIDPCPADLNGDGTVDVLDLLVLLNSWGPCPPTGVCVGDLNCDDIVDVLDLLLLLNAWGQCP